VSRRTQDNSVFDEPHLRGRQFGADPTEQTAADSPSGESLQALDSVFNEPSMRANGGTGRTYGDWLTAKQRAMTGHRSWATMLLIALAAGPFAIVSAFWGSGQTIFSIMAIVVFGPVVEEMGKVGLTLIAVERRPDFVRSTWQILIVGFVSGLVFASVENVLYLQVYIHEPTMQIIVWRWTVCVGLHVGCAMIASIGVAAIWREVQLSRQPARVERGFRFFAAAIILHGTYNLSMLILEPFVFVGSP